jgi:hypothetical protein
MKFASVPSNAGTEALGLNKPNRFAVLINTDNEYEILLATVLDRQELPFTDYAEKYPYSFNFKMKFVKNKIVITATISKNFKKTYGKYAYLEALELLMKRAMRNIF